MYKNTYSHVVGAVGAVGGNCICSYLFTTALCMFAGVYLSAAVDYVFLCIPLAAVGALGAPMYFCIPLRCWIKCMCICLSQLRMNMCICAYGVASDSRID